MNFRVPQHQLKQPFEMSNNKHKRSPTLWIRNVSHTNHKMNYVIILVRSSATPRKNEDEFQFVRFALFIFSPVGSSERLVDNGFVSNGKKETANKKEEKIKKTQNYWMRIVEKIWNSTAEPWSSFQFSVYATHDTFRCKFFIRNFSWNWIEFCRFRFIDFRTVFLLNNFLCVGAR